jgi:hypothetical protein
MSKATSRRAYEDRFTVEHGMSRGAYRWHFDARYRAHESIEGYGRRLRRVIAAEDAECAANGHPGGCLCGFGKALEGLKLNMTTE